MNLRQLSLETLKELEGGIPAAAFNHHLHRIAVDCMERPADGKERVVNLKLVCKPMLQPDGDCTEVKMQIFVTSSIPTHKTKVYSCGLKRNGALAFNPDSLDAVDQATFLSDEDD